MHILLAVLLLISLGFLKKPSSPNQFVATAYCLKGKTASGTKVALGTIAADPRVLPMGTRVKIDGLGEYTVRDTGGAIKGKRIDVWVPTLRLAKKFGRKIVKVTKL